METNSDAKKKQIEALKSLYEGYLVIVDKMQDPDVHNPEFYRGQYSKLASIIDSVDVLFPDVSLKEWDDIVLNADKAHSKAKKDHFKNEFFGPSN